MNAVESLLKMQSDMQEDPAVSRALDEAARGVQSMLIRYEKLYNSENYANISISEYLRSLLGEIDRILPPGISISAEVPDLTLDANIISSLGIKINELITNSLKYAFPDNDGSMTIEATTASACLTQSASKTHPGSACCS